VSFVSTVTLASSTASLIATRSGTPKTLFLQRNPQQITVNPAVELLANLPKRPRDVHQSQSACVHYTDNLQSVGADIEVSLIGQMN
jgi:hypothetical protein